MIEIVVYVDCNELSPNKRLHRYAMNRIKRKQRNAAHNAWLEAGRPQLGVPVVVDLLITRRRRMDEGNVWGGLKTVIDQLFNAKRHIKTKVIGWTWIDACGVTPDDSARWFRQGTITWRIGRDYIPSVRFLIRPRM